MNSPHERVLLLQGATASSTRAELAGAIMLLLRPMPIFMNSGSMAMLGRAVTIVTRQWNNIRAKPWELVTDGDLWDAFQRVIAWRHWGAHKWMEWGKGHATHG